MDSWCAFVHLCHILEVSLEPSALAPTLLAAKCANADRLPRVVHSTALLLRSVCSLALLITPLPPQAKEFRKQLEAAGVRCDTDLRTNYTPGEPSSWMNVTFSSQHLSMPPQHVYNTLLLSNLSHQL